MAWAKRRSSCHLLQHVYVALVFETLPLASLLMPTDWCGTSAAINASGEIIRKHFDYQRVGICGPVDEALLLRQS